LLTIHEIVRIIYYFWQINDDDDDDDNDDDGLNIYRYESNGKNGNIPGASARTLTDAASLAWLWVSVLRQSSGTW